MFGKRKRSHVRRLEIALAQRLAEGYPSYDSAYWWGYLDGGRDAGIVPGTPEALEALKSARQKAMAYDKARNLTPQRARAVQKAWESVDL